MGGTGAILRAQDPSYARSGWISIFDFLIFFEKVSTVQRIGHHDEGRQRKKKGLRSDGRDKKTQRQRQKKPTTYKRPVKLHSLLSIFTRPTPPPRLLFCGYILIIYTGGGSGPRRHSRTKKTEGEWSERKRRSERRRKGKRLATITMVPPERKRRKQTHLCINSRTNFTT